MSQKPEIKWMSIRSVIDGSILKDTDDRSPFLKAYGSIIHRSLFRRLSDKTQVHINRENDYLRTRLTHSIEAQQIGRQLARKFCNLLGINVYQVNEQNRNFPQDFEDLVASACLVHDIGHPPFGHIGEEALNNALKYLKESKRLNPHFFESNKQNIRLLLGSGLGRPYSVTYSLVDAVMKYKDDTYKNNLKKYPGYYDEEKDKVQEILKETTLEHVKHPACYLMEAADDISYLCGDIEDAIKLKQINKDTLIAKLEDLPFDEEINKEKWTVCIKDHFENTPNEITNHVMKALVQHCCQVLESLDLKNTFYNEESHRFPLRLKDKIKHIQHPKEKLNLLYCTDQNDQDQIREKIKEIKNWIYKGEGSILKSPTLVEDLFIAQQRIESLYKKLYNYCVQCKSFKDPSQLEESPVFLMLPSHIQRKIKANAGDHIEENLIARWVCDYISGMTDSFATSLWKKYCTLKACQ